MLYHGHVRQQKVYKEVLQVSKYAQQYYNAVEKIFKGVLEDEKDSIAAAAKLMSEAIKNENLVHVIGPGGHSNMGAYEMFWRAGGLVPINAILDPGTDLTHGAKRSNHIERLPGYIKAVFDSYRISDGVLIIVNAYGINSMTIDSALEAKKRGIPTIGVTSTSFATKVPKDHPARHPSGKNLHEIVDVFVDCHMPYGDAIVQFEGLEQQVAPSSTLSNTFTVNLLLIETVKQLIEMGIDPPLWKSANLPGGDQSNAKYESKYGPMIKHLL
jgi:uncharacterized phosphosugar-binding protein